MELRIQILGVFGAAVSLLVDIISLQLCQFQKLGELLIGP